MGFISQQKVYYFISLWISLKRHNEYERSTGTQIMFANEFFTTNAQFCRMQRGFHWRQRNNIKSKGSKVIFLENLWLFPAWKIKSNLAFKMQYYIPKLHSVTLLFLQSFSGLSYFEHIRRKFHLKFLFILDDELVINKWFIDLLKELPKNAFSPHSRLSAS